MAKSLPKDFFKPFDKLYATVTEKADAHAKNLPDADAKRWLETLIREFQNERNLWNGNADDPYFTECRRLKQKVLYLTACAYLHISYDLPRVIADNWPMSSPNWTTGPSEDTGENIYLGMTRIFPKTFRYLANDKEVVGFWKWPAYIVPKSALEAAAHWALHLRTAAWIHARRLQKESKAGRNLREEKMLQAMKEALVHVGGYRPWTAGVLQPPHDAFQSFALLPLPAIPMSDWTPGLFAMVGAFLGSFFAVLFWWRKQEGKELEEELAQFVSEFAQRVLEYTDVAVNDPDGFDKYVEDHAPERLK
jgi:hypothetical protein